MQQKRKPKSYIKEFFSDNREHKFATRLLDNLKHEVIELEKKKKRNDIITNYFIDKKNNPCACFTSKKNTRKNIRIYNGGGWLLSKPLSRQKQANTNNKKQILNFVEIEELRENNVKHSKCRYPFVLFQKKIL